MNIELANRLYEYRKQSGLSQEELAEKLGISRQSVSKWERAESCPDTDNLIELSKIYNVTMDELLNTSKDIVTSTKEEVVKEEVVEKNYRLIIDYDSFEDDNDNEIILNENEVEVVRESDGYKYKLSYEDLYVNVEGKETKITEIDGFGKNSVEPSDKALKVRDIINGTSILIIATLYVALCALKVMDWGKFWVVFVYYPALASLAETIAYKDARKFAFPILLAGIYVTLGMYFDGWHPYWFIFLLVPIYHTICDIIYRKKIEVYYYDLENDRRKFKINEGTIKVVLKKEK